MINTTISGYPVIRQSDNTYTLPSVTGAVQWNGTYKKFQVSNGTGWTDIDNTVNYYANNDLSEVIHYVLKKIEEEKLLEEKAKNNPCINDLIKQRKEIDEKIKMVDILTR